MASLCLVSNLFTVLEKLKINIAWQTSFGHRTLQTSKVISISNDNMASESTLIKIFRQKTTSAGWNKVWWFRQIARLFSLDRFFCLARLQLRQSPDEREKAHEKYPKKYSNCLPSNAKNLFAVYFVFGRHFFSREFFRVNRNKIFWARLDVIKLFRLFADPIRSESTARRR